MTPQRPDASTLERIAELEWYHTIELAPGIVTPGWFDTREFVKRIAFPNALDGRRCLDVGTFDGFWAFEMERRGAAEVIAIDILDPAQWDWPAGSSSEAIEAIGRRKAMGEGFEVARQALGSRVKRLDRSVYDLDPETDGVFDFVYLGSLLLHLRDPVGALSRVRRVCSGDILVVDAIDLGLTIAHRKLPMATLDAVGRPWWWKPNLAALVRMVESAGFSIVGRPGRRFIPPGPGQHKAKLTPRALASRTGREIYLRERWGDPHGVVLARAG